MDKVIFGLCAVTATLCAFFLLRGYFRTRTRLLLWSGLCFVFLSVNNVLVIADRWIFPDIPLMNLRLATSLVGILFLIYGLVWERD